MATRTIANAGGNWSATATWAEGAVPTSSDDVVATATSGALTCDSATNNCRSFDMTGYTSTLTINTACVLDVYGATSTTVNCKLVAGMTVTFTGTASLRLRIVTTGAQINLTTAGKSLGALEIGNTTSALGSAVFQDAVTVTGTVSHSGGTFTTNGQTCSWGSLSCSNSSTRTLTLGVSAIGITGGGATAWDMTTTTGLTLTANTATITFSGAAQTMTAGSKTYGGLIDFTGTGTMVLTGSGVFANVRRIAVASGDILSIPANFTITSSFTLTGTGATTRMQLISNSFVSVRTITMSGTPTVTFTNVDVQDMTFTGAYTNSSTMVGDIGGNTNAPVSASVATSWNSTGGGNWSDVTKWTGGRVPLPQDDVTISQVFVGSPTVTMNVAKAGRTIDFSGSSGTFTVTLSTSITLYGSLIYAVSMTAPTTLTWTFAGRQACTLDLKGKLANSVSVNTTTAGSLTLASEFVASATTTAFTLTTGILTLNGFNLTTGTFTWNQSSSTALRQTTLNAGASIINLTGTGSVWNYAPTAGTPTFNVGTSIIVLSNSSATSKTFVGGGQTYNNVMSVAGGSGALAFTGNNIFNDLIITTTTARTVTLPAGGTQTVNGQLVLQGAAGQLLSVVSATPTTASTIASANTVEGKFLSLTDSTITGAGTYYAMSSTNVSNNTGWTFGNFVTANQTKPRTALQAMRTSVV